MNLDEASALAERIRASKRGFMTISREELRAIFEIGKLTEQQSQLVCDALKAVDILVHPHPYQAKFTIRLYDLRHELGVLAHAVIAPDTITDAPINAVADRMAREQAGIERRSDDTPWIYAFDLFLQIVIGRQSHEWEDICDDRYPGQLAHQLAAALGLDSSLPERSSALRLAASVCASRPTSKPHLASDYQLPGASAEHIASLVEQLETARAMQVSEHYNILVKAAQLLLGRESIPTQQVELGVLGLRYRRENYLSILPGAAL